MSFLQRTSQQKSSGIQLDTNLKACSPAVSSGDGNGDGLGSSQCESEDESAPLSPASVASDSSAGSWGKMSQASRGPPAIRRHPEYYIESGDVVFVVESHLFKVHSYFFIRESNKFKEVLCVPSRTGTVLRASSDSYPVELRDASSKDFARFLWVFYNPNYSYEATISKWASILRLAHLWSFPKIKSLAIREMDQLPISPVDKAVMAREFQVDPARRWLETAYAALGAREAPLTKEEGMRLGLDVVLHLAEVREKIRERRREESGEKERMDVGGSTNGGMNSRQGTSYNFLQEAYLAQRAASTAAPKRETHKNVAQQHRQQQQQQQYQQHPNPFPAPSPSPSGSPALRPVSPTGSDQSYDERMAESMYLPPKPPSPVPPQPSSHPHLLPASPNPPSPHPPSPRPAPAPSQHRDYGRSSIYTSGSGRSSIVVGGTTSSSSQTLTTPPMSQNFRNLQEFSRSSALMQKTGMGTKTGTGMGARTYSEEDVAAVQEVFAL